MWAPGRTQAVVQVWPEIRLRAVTAPSTDDAAPAPVQPANVKAAAPVDVWAGDRDMEPDGDAFIVNG